MSTLPPTTASSSEQRERNWPLICATIYAILLLGLRLNYLSAYTLASIVLWWAFIYGVCFVVRAVWRFVWRFIHR